jgi:hypothetical protein
MLERGVGSIVDTSSGAVGVFKSLIDLTEQHWDDQHVPGIERGAAFERADAGSGCGVFALNPLLPC